MTRRPGASAFVTVLLLAAACWADPGLERTGDPEIDISLGISPTPPMTGRAQIRVTVEDGGGPLPEGGRVLAGLAGSSPATGGSEDPSGGADAARVGELTPRADGGWTGELDFPAPGEALVEIRVIRPDGTGATLRVPVTVARRPGS